MAKKKEFNEYVIEGDTTKIKVSYKQLTLWTIIDTEDLQKLISLGYHWYARYRKYLNNYYIQCNTYFDGIHKNVLLHQFVLNYFDPYGIDHIDNNSLNNTKNNLRISDHRQNHRNRKSRNSNNKTGYRNVSFSHDKYIVTLQVDGKQKTLGTFDDVDEAGRFAEEMRLKYYGDWAGKN